jgi:hypothetical protein
MTNQPKATQTLEEYCEIKPLQEVMEDVSGVEHVLAKDELKKLEVVRGRIKFYLKPTSHTYTITKKQS